MTIDDLAARLDAMKAKNDADHAELSQRLDGIGQCFDSFSASVIARFNAVDQGFIQMNQKMQDMNRKIDGISHP